MPSQFADGNYYVRVVGPGGNVLGTSPNSRHMTSNVFDDSSNPGGCTQIIQLVKKASDNTQQGFDLTDNKGGEYKVEISKNSDFANQVKSDNFKIDEQQCSLCSADPAIDIIKTTQGEIGRAHV